MLKTINHPLKGQVTFNYHRELTDAEAVVLIDFDIRKKEKQKLHLPKYGAIESKNAVSTNPPPRF